MTNVMTGGTSPIQGWDQGDKIRSISGVKVGDLMLQVDHQFQAQNMLRITSLSRTDFQRNQICYGIFVNPDMTSDPRMGGDSEMAIWDYDFQHPRREYFAVTKVEELTLSGSMIVGLMLRCKVKIRDIKARHGITLKRIREIREKGAKGFRAEEWVFIITGQWPAKGWSYPPKK